ncbi:MAG TPA: hypothetical protein VMZ69_11705 [Saprospiraceae bacterium]|nr:hypothetical protein [Saprospiraceae bacterium]
MNIPYLFFITSICFFNSSSCCKPDECPKVVLPEQFLDVVSYTFQSWDSVQAFIYVDSLNNEYSYPRTKDVEFLSHRKHEGYCDDSSGSFEWDSKDILKHYTHNNKTTIIFSQFISFTEQEEDLFTQNLVDRLAIFVYDSLTSNSDASMIQLMTSPKESQENQMDYNNLTSTFYDSLTIMTKQFYNVYEQKNGKPKMYYTKEQGVISFTDNQGIKLVLERIE